MRRARLVVLDATWRKSRKMLAQPEGDAARYQPLLRAFDGFAAQQLAFRGGLD